MKSTRTFQAKPLLLLSWLLVLLGFLSPTWAWVQPSSTMHRTVVHSHRPQSTLRLAADEDELTSSSSSPSFQRRAFLTWIATAAAAVSTSALLTTPPAHALPVMSMPAMPTVPDLEADFEAFEKSLQDFQFNPSKWPESPSPLPTRVQSAQELTAPDGIDRKLLPQMPQSVLGPTELEQAIQDSIRKRRVDPLTHG